MELLKTLVKVNQLMDQGCLDDAIDTLRDLNESQGSPCLELDELIREEFVNDLIRNHIDEGEDGYVWTYRMLMTVEDIYARWFSYQYNELKNVTEQDVQSYIDEIVQKRQKELTWELNDRKEEFIEPLERIREVCEDLELEDAEDDMAALISYIEELDPETLELVLVRLNRLETHPVISTLKDEEVKDAIAKIKELLGEDLTFETYFEYLN